FVCRVIGESEASEARRVRLSTSRRLSRGDIIGQIIPPRRMISTGGPMIGIVIILVILWFLGVVTKNTLGGLLHILLVVAIIFLLINVIRARGVYLSMDLKSLTHAIVQLSLDLTAIAVP